MNAEPQHDRVAVGVVQKQISLTNEEQDMNTLRNLQIIFFGFNLRKDTYLYIE